MIHELITSAGSFRKTINITYYTPLRIRHGEEPRYLSQLSKNYYKGRVFQLYMEYITQPKQQALVKFVSQSGYY